MMSAFSAERGFEDLRRRHHDAEIDDLVVVALEHDADDVLADVVHVALHRRHHDLAVGAALDRAAGGLPRCLFLLHERHQVGDRLLHHARRLHHLRQEHLAGAEQVADHVHAVHQRAFDHVQRALRLGARLLGVGLDEIGDAVHQRMREPPLDRPFAPGEIGLLLLDALPAVTLGEREQRSDASGRRLSTTSSQASRSSGSRSSYTAICAGIDDAHVHAGLDGVIEEHRVHRLAHRLVAAEREREVRHAAGDVHVRQLLRGSAASPR